MKRVIALLLCLVLVACSFIACDETETKEPATHVHTYAETWSSDAEGHWYDATCTCTDAPLRKLAHTDANNDGACDVCTFSNHTHTYAEGWTADCTNHWRAADCGHIVAGTDVQAHADTNEDGKCDTCAYVIEDIHTHYYATAWSHDADNHWHAALCEHSVEVADKAAHEINAAGVCTVCQAKVKEVDTTNLGELLAASVANNHKVVSGKVMYAYTIPEFDMTSTHAQYYTLGNGSTYVNREQYEVSNQSWYQLIGEDEVFGVTTYDGGYTLEPVAVGVAEMGGYTYTPSTLLAGFENTSSLSETLYELYTLSQNEGVSEYTVKHNAATKSYSFSYTYLIVNKVSGGESLGGNDENPSANVETYNTSLFTVDVKFTYDENYVITTADFIVGAYNEAIDGDYSYDPTTGKVTLVENAYADTYTYNVYQTAGERTYSTEYPKASIVPSAFNLSYKDEIIGEKVTVDAGVYTQFSLTEILPLGALINFIEPEDVVIEVKNDDAQATMQTVDMLYSNWSYTIGFNANSLDYVGTYTVTVSYAGNLIKTFKMEIKTPAVGKVLACVFENQWGWDGEVYTANEDTAVTNATLEAGEVLDFVGLIKPTLLAQNYTVKVIDENDADVTATTISKATLADAMVFYEYQASYEAYRFSTDVAGTYKVIVTSTEDTTVSATLTVTVEAAPVLSESATYEFVTPGNFAQTDEVTFTAGTAGTYVISAEGLADTTWLQYYDAAEDMWPQIQGNLPYSVELEAGETLTLRLFGWDDTVAGTPVTVTVEKAVESISGTYIGTDDWGNAFLTVEIDDDAKTAIFTFNHPMFGPSSAAFTYTVDADDTVTLYDAEGNVVNPMAGRLTLTDGKPTSADYNGSVYSLTKKEPISGTYIGTDNWGNAFLTVEIDDDAKTAIFTFNHPMLGSSSVSYTYEVDAEGTVTLYDEEGNVVNPMAGMLVFTDGKPTSADYNGTHYTLAKEGATNGSEGNGTEADPYILTETGDYVCEFPGGWNPIWYAFTATEDGIITVSSTFATAWLMCGEDPMFAENNFGDGSAVSYTVTAGTTVYIGVGDWDEAEIDVPFTVTVE
ncbi:MAG: hypothetical protein J6B71_02420 [Clostridia bacterium]|nr:hypothetical protein [Clostridia bacterium]